MVSEVKQTNTSKYWTKYTEYISENGKSKYNIHTGSQNELDWRCRLTQMIQRLEGRDRTPTQHTLLSHQKSGDKCQVCQSMGWKGSQDISQHGRSGQKGQSKDYVGHSQRLDKAQIWWGCSIHITQSSQSGQQDSYIHLYPRGEESSRSVQFLLYGRLQGQANQKFHCGRSQ